MTRHGFVAVSIFGVIALMIVRLPPMVAKQDSVLNTYRALVEVNALAKQRYVVPVRHRRLVDGAIRGMLWQLDPYSGYISPDELPAFRRRSSGEYIGIGLEVGIQDGKMTVIAPVANGPAARSGVLAGDIILAVDGKSTSDQSVFDIDERLTGKPGTKVTLSIQHRGAERTAKPIDIEIARGSISLETVRGFKRAADGSWDYLITGEKRIAYFRVSAFRESTAREMSRALRKIGPVQGIVLDLRFNPGGLLDQAVAMVDRFVKTGLIVETLTRRRVETKYYAHRLGTLSSIPLCVLINGGSASSSEIVAGALQDHRRASIVGTRSFGKGSVQHMIELESIEGAVKLTVGYYRLPGGRIIHRSAGEGAGDAWGVFPDHVIELSPAEEQAIQQRRMSVDAKATGGDGEAALLLDEQLRLGLELVREAIDTERSL